MKMHRRWKLVHNRNIVNYEGYQLYTLYDKYDNLLIKIIQGKDEIIIPRFLINPIYWKIIKSKIKGDA